MKNYIKSTHLKIVNLIQVKYEKFVYNFICIFINCLMLKKKVLSQ